MGSPDTAATPPSAARLTGRAAILLLVTLVLAVSYASSARAWLAQRGEISTLQAEITQRQAAVSALEQTRRRWHDPAYIEAQARLRFGWVMPGETGYRVIDDHGNVLPDGSSQLSAPAVTAAANARQWWQNEWATVVQAGRDPEAVAASKRPDHTPAKRIGGHHRRGKTPVR